MKWFKYIGIFMLFIAAGFYGMLLLAPSEVNVQVNKDINAPIDAVYAALSDHKHFPEWIRGVKSTRQLSGDGPGNRAEYSVAFEGQGNMVMKHKTTVYEPHNQYAYIGTVDDFMEVNSNTTLEALDSNSTRISTKLTIKALSNKMKMFMYADETHRKNAADNYVRLKEYLEK